MANFHPLRRARLLVVVPLAAAVAVPAALPAQGAQLFRDGFESGTPWHWSALPGGIDPRAICLPPFAPVDMTGATTVGSGTPGSCTQAALDAALASNDGRIRFDCGPALHTIVVTSEKVIDDDLVIDGGGRITLSGGGTNRILGIRPPWGTTPLPTVTLQQLYGVFLLYMSWRFIEPRKVWLQYRGLATPAVEEAPQEINPPFWALIVLGIVAGILSGMFGIGGGVVIVPALVAFLRFDQKQAVGTSLAVLLLPVSLGAVITYYNDGKLDPGVAAFVAFGLLFGAFGGAKLALNLPTATVKRMYGLFLLFVGLRFILQF